jgi:hypothetical protein
MDAADYSIHAGTGGKEGFLRHLEHRNEHHYYTSVAYQQCLDIVHNCATYAEARALIDAQLKPLYNQTSLRAWVMRQVYETVMRSLSAAIVREGGSLS